MWLLAVAVFVVPLLLFAPTLGHDFVWDDRSILLPNPALGDWSRLGELLTSDFFRESQEQGPFDYWRPLVVLTHMVERSLFGGRPAGYHAVNVVLHATASMLVFLLGLGTLGRPAPALAGGLLFAVHPVHVEVVAWVSGRSDLLLGLFLALALLGDWLAGRSGHRRWQAVALAGFAAALASKESAAVFPALVAARAALAGPVSQRPRQKAARALGAALPALGVLGAFLLVRYGLLDVVPPQGAAAEPADRLALFWTWWSALWLYARLLVWPAGLSIAHDLPLAGDPGSWTVAAGLCVCAAAIWGVVRLRRTVPGASFGLVVLLATLAPLSHFLVPITSHVEATFPVAERFLYAPSIGFCLVAGWLLMEALPRALTVARGALRPPGGLPGRLVPAAFLGLALVAAAGTSALRARDWRDEATLFAATLRSSPDSAMARLNHAAALMELARGETDGEARRALLLRALADLQRAVALAPANYRGHYDLGNLHQALGRPAAAESSFREALRLRPELFQAMVNLGGLLAQTGRPAEALAWLERAERLQPGELAVAVNRAHVLQMLGRPEEAVPLYRRALAVDPELVAARAGLARALETLAEGQREGS